MRVKHSTRVRQRGGAEGDRLPCTALKRLPAVSISVPRSESANRSTSLLHHRYRMITLRRTWSTSGKTPRAIEPAVPSDDCAFLSCVVRDLPTLHLFGKASKLDSRPRIAGPVVPALKAHSLRLCSAQSSPVGQSWAHSSSMGAVAG